MASTKKAATTKEDVKKAAQTVKEETKKVAEKAKADTKVAKEAVKESAKKTAEKATKKADEAKKAAKETAKKAEKTTKAAASTAKKAAKKTAQKIVTKDIYFEFGDKQVDTVSLADMAEKAYVANGGKASAIKSMKLYVKAEDNAVYYVINDKETGKIAL